MTTKNQRTFLPVTVLSVFLFLCLSVHSQQLFSSPSALAQKIYLQTDAKAYAVGATIWFKAIVTGAGDHIPGSASGVLYAELIDASENIVDRKLVKLDKGIGSSFFQLAPHYAPGYYQVRAYTEWNKNFGTDFFFTDYVWIGASEGKVDENLIERITILEKEESKNKTLNVDLTPGTMDSIGGKDMTVFVRSDQRTDTLAVKKNKVGRYSLDYAVPNGTSLLTVKVQTDNGLKQARTIALDTTLLDLQFTPESGELVHGLPSIIGIKALDYKGRGKTVTGNIVNSKGESVASFTTNHLGMGWVQIEKVDSTQHYKARISTANKLTKTYPFPIVVQKGSILSVKRASDQIQLTALSNYLYEDSIIVEASCRGRVYHNLKAKLTEGAASLSLSSNTLPEGIVAFALLINNTPVAQRLFFNQRQDTRLSITAVTEKQTYAQREEAKLTIDTKNSKGEATAAHLSLVALHQPPTGSFMNHRQNILSYFLLSSDLKGVVETPGYYFERGKEAERFTDLDALMLTQGWSRYLYPRGALPSYFAYKPEPGLSVSGSVKGGLSNKRIIGGANLTLMTFGKEKGFATATTDSLGRFFFPLPEDYSGVLPVLIQSADKTKAKDYLVTLDEKASPPSTFDHHRSIETADSTIKEYIKKTLENRKTEESAEGVTLQEVIVKSRILSPQQKKVTDKYGAATTIIDGEEIRKREEKWNSGFYDALQYAYRDKLKLNVWQAFRGPFLLAGVPNKIGTTLVVIDGIAAKVDPTLEGWPGDYFDLSYIPASEVKSFEIIENAKNFKELWCEAYARYPAQVCARGPNTGNVIAIYTQAGRGLSGAFAATGISNKRIPVFSPTREFYTPKYNSLKEEDWKIPDLRSLIHWAPVQKTNNEGKASLSFYNGDNTGNVQVVVEAITAKGEIGYSELLYEVKKKSN